MTYVSIFITFFKIGLFTFGGGYATIALIQNEIVERNGWITHEQFLQIVAIADMTPGPVGINCATFVGYRVAGVAGSIIATVAVILPSFIIISFLFYLLKRYMEKAEHKATLFFEYMRPGVLALILAASIFIAQRSIASYNTAAVAVAAFLLTIATKVNSLIIIVAAGVAGVLMSL